MDFIMNGFQPHLHRTPWHSVRFLTGLIFVFAGVGKALLPVLIPALGLDAPSFPEVLREIGIPFPVLSAALVCALEIVGGLSLTNGKWAKLFIPLLAMDMLGAILSVGLPASLGTPIIVEGIAIGSESWRLPLEGGLLAALIWTWWREVPRGLLKAVARA